MKPTYIFDCDGVLLDSSHRARFVNGKIDLDHWRSHSTPDRIAQDAPLPLANYARLLVGSGSRVLVCTSRVISEADREVIRKHTGITEILHRSGEGDRRSDAKLKHDLLSGWLTSNKIARPDRIAFFDDLVGNVRAARSLGLRAVKVTPPSKSLEIFR